MSPGQQALLFLLHNVAMFYVSILLLRVLLFYAQVNVRSPLARFVVTLTNPVLRPLYALFPFVKGWDFPALFVAWLISAIMYVVTQALGGQIIALFYASLKAIFMMAEQLIWVFIITIVAEVILSWVNPHAYSEWRGSLGRVTGFVLRPLRRLNLVVAHFDLAPIIAIVLLQTLLILIP